MKKRTQEIFNAVVTGDFDEVRNLLDSSPELASAVDNSGNTLLHVANSEKMVNLLSSKGVSAEKVNNAGEYADEAALSRKQGNVARAIQGAWPEIAKG